MRIQLPTIYRTFVLIISGLVALSAHGQAKDCCSVSTQQWYTPASKAACEAAGDVHASNMASNIAAIQACTQNTMKQAQDAYSGTIPGLPAGIPGMPPGGQIPGMPVGTTPVNAEPVFECCNISAGDFLGEMSEQACRAEGSSFFPDTPENLDKTNVCHQQTAGGGGGAWSVDDYEENIENGGMEDWASENRPREFTTYGVNPNLTKGTPLDIQVAFRSRDAHTGQWSIRLKNLDITSQLPPEASMAKAFMGPQIFTLPAGLATCKEPCPTETGDNSGSVNPEVFNSLRATDVKSFVCGAYKGYIAASDELVIAVNTSGGEGGFTSGLQKGFTRTSSDWIEFAIPMQAYPGGAIPETADVGINARIMARGNPMTFGSSPFTEVWLDSFHFCDPMQLIAFKPEVISGNTTTRIADREEESLGVQTFVNLDNDDEDGAFDNLDTDGVDGDDELVRLRLELPMNSFGKVELKADKVGDMIELWDDAGKKTKFETYNDEVEVEELLRANADGTKFIRDVWVEALKPSARPKDQAFTFIFKNRLNNDEQTEDEIVLTALAMKSLKWQGLKNSADDTDQLDEDPNWPDTADGKAYRVFPGKRFDGDEPEATPRHVVLVKAELNVAPTRPVKLWFRAFDIDDPTASGDEVDREDADEDNRTAAPYSKGRFVGNMEDIQEFEMDSATGEFRYQVPTQPGDNVKIVAAADKDFLEQLENDDVKLFEKGPVHTSKIVDKHIFKAEDSVAKARIRQPESWSTDTLTIWRKLFIEIDTMDRINHNELEAVIQDVRPMGDVASPSGNQTWQKICLTINKNLYDQLPETSKFGRTWYGDNFVGGHIIWNQFKYGIDSHTNREAGVNDEICLAYPKDWRPLTNDDRNDKIVIRDDDQDKNGSYLPPMVVTVKTTAAFKPAYVLPVTKDIPNSNSTRPFLLHLESDELSYLHELFDAGFDNKAHSRDDNFWMIYLLNAYQGKLDEDGDGRDKGSALSGQSDNDYGAVILQESGRETGAAYAAKGNGTGWQLPDVPPHEIAHLFGAIHSDQGLMGYSEKKTETFEPITLDRIRSKDHP